MKNSDTIGQQFQANYARAPQWLRDRTSNPTAKTDGEHLPAGASAINAIVYAAAGYYLGRSPLLAAILGASVVAVAYQTEDRPGLVRSAADLASAPGAILASWILK